MSRSVENELRHYGVLGMKWGVRRYQNKDGTLTSAGRRRQTRVSSSREEGKRYANKQKKGVGAANALITAERKAKSGVVDREFLDNPNISQKAKNRVRKTASKNESKETRVSSSREEGKRYANEQKKGVDAANALITAERKTASKNESKGKRTIKRDKIVEGRTLTDRLLASVGGLTASSSKKQTRSKNESRIRDEISKYDKKNPGFAKKFYDNYDDLEMWDVYSPKQLIDELK